MVLQHNILSIFTNRQLGMNTNGIKKNMEKLSSGYRINRAADDAAGLSISEKMRSQIRGLHQGMENINDGISLIKTADGAMSEVHSILQRMRELTVQAYNDVEGEEDRDCIQSEIDELLIEIEEIRTTTEFNKKPVLMGNPTHLIQVTGDEKIEAYTTMFLTKDKPTWLIVDDSMQPRGYTQPQDTSGIMYSYDGVNPATKEYYGPQNASVNAGFTHVAEWSPTIADNASAKIDFSGLTGTNTGLDLYTKLYELIGTKISFPCGTCTDQVNSIAFAGSEQAISTKSFANAAKYDISTSLNLSTEKFTYGGVTYNGYFEAVQELLLNRYSNNYNPNSTQQNPTGESQDAHDLSNAIAKDLATKTFNKLSHEMTRDNHFDRAVQSDDYSLIIYDYRDDNVLSSHGAANTPVYTSCNVEYSMQVNLLKPGTMAEVRTPQIIQRGPDDFPIYIDFPDLSLDRLNLRDFSVNRYKETSVYSDEYRDKLIHWENDTTLVPRSRQETFCVIDSFQPPVYSTKYVNGEAKTICLSPGRVSLREEVRNIPYMEKVYNSPKPIPSPGDIKTVKSYMPDPLQRLDDAISIVSFERSHMGAQQNRLEYAYNINANSHENSQSAESRIRDTDMAEEIVGLSKNSILQQAAQSMLAQANHSTEAILNLLQ